MKIGYWAPLPPAPSGVADYAAELLRALRQHAQVSVNAPGDVDLYHIGNNSLHRRIYERALAYPGVVILHDAVLHHFLLGALEQAEYVSEFRYNYGAWAEQTAGELWAARSRSAADPRFFRYPMLRRLAERSRAILVHNPAAATLVRDHSPAARVAIVRHLHVPEEPAAPFAITRLRADMGVLPHELLFGVFGYLRESKRIAAVLRAFTVARRVVPVRLLVAGDFVSATWERAISPLLRAAGVIRRPHLDQRAFLLHASAVDACINLRYPSAGETSGIKVRLMGLGKPVILTDSPENDDPPDTCLRVSAGLAEEEELAAQMVAVASRPRDARQIGSNAAAWIRREHDPDRAAIACYHECSIASPAVQR